MCIIANKENIMNEEYSKGMSQLLELARDIEENPSKLHCKCTHKDAPQTPDFDWNVFVGRIDAIIQEKKVIDSPFRRCQMVLALLNADLTYDNRSRAKKLLHQMADTLEQQEQEQRRRDQEERKGVQQVQNMCLTSPTLTDEFWQNAVDESKKCKCICSDCQSQRMGKEIKETIAPAFDQILKEEKQRFDQLVSDYSIPSG